jgi:uracil-DNA glycosylase family 4
MPKYSLEQLRAGLARIATAPIPDDPPGLVFEDKEDEAAFRAAIKEMEEFDWVGRVGAPEPYLMSHVTQPESEYDRKLRMLRQVQKTCMACTMCPLGRKMAVRDDQTLDPHVFSNLNPQPFMVIGQNPGWTEVQQGQPFVGDAGGNFDREVARNGLSRDDFYIGNTVRCFTPKNSRPEYLHISRCRPFLEIEINIIRPLLVVALGGVAFEQLCPHEIARGVKFSDALKKITHSRQYEVPVFAVYHPSPLNLEDPERAAAFKDQMRVLCQLVKRLKEN